MGLLQPFSLDQMAGAAALVLGSLGGFALICFKSRCTTISLLWGCWSCQRQVPIASDSDAEEPAGAAEP
jgi:hypothetical protein